MKNKQNLGVVTSEVAAPTGETTKELSIKPINKLTEIINKVANYQRKVMQLQTLREKESELRQFNVSGDLEEGGRFELRDSDGKRFDTSNIYLVKAVIERLQVEFANRIPELEKELETATL